MGKVYALMFKTDWKYAESAYDEVEQVHVLYSTPEIANEWMKAQEKMCPRMVWWVQEMTVYTDGPSKE